MSWYDGRDQAEGLIGLGSRPPLRVIAVASGKGGVGKTSIAVNLSVALAAAGTRTLLLDADLGLANVDVLMGLAPSANISHVLDGSSSLCNVILEGPHGLQVVPAASGVKRLAELSGSEVAGLIRAFESLTVMPEVLVVDVAAGIAEDVVRFCQAAHHVLVVVCDEPASVTDAYALVKVLSRDFGIRRFKILANQTSDAAHGRALYDKLERVAERFLNVELRYAGYVPGDEQLRRAVQRQRAVVDLFPAAPASRALRKLAQATERWPIPTGLRGHIEFFVEQLAVGSVAG